MSQTSCVFAILSAFLPVVAMAADVVSTPAGVHEIDIKGVKLGAAMGKPFAPVAINSTAELEKAVPEAEAQVRIKAGVDFTKEQLVLFVWSGSGQDRVTAAEEKVDGKTVAVFTYAAGRTRDFRPHQSLFALPADGTWKMAVAKP